MLRIVRCLLCVTVVGWLTSVLLAQETDGPTMADDSLVVIDPDPALPRPGVPRYPTTGPTSRPAEEPARKPFAQWPRATGKWFGVRQWLDDRGIDVAPSITLDFAKNLRGGDSTNGFNAQRLFNLNLTIDTDALFGWKGGTFFANLQHHHGDGADEDVGDFCGTSNLTADFDTQLAELWYEQKLVDEKLRARLGKIDANSEFAYAEYAAEFVNSAMGSPATSPLLPTYPDPATGMTLFAHPADSFYAGGGICDGAAADGIRTGRRGPATFLGSSGVFLIGECGLKWKAAANRNYGRTAIGAWWHTGQFDGLDAQQHGAANGAYFVLDQSLWREDPQAEDDAQGIGMFLQYDWADPDISPADHHVAGGLGWTGPVPSRDDDMLGLGLSYVHFSNARLAGFADDFELAAELFYKIQLTPFLSVKTDVQYIVNPGGSKLDDALVFLVRVETAF